MGKSDHSKDCTASTSAWAYIIDILWFPIKYQTGIDRLLPSISEDSMFNVVASLMLLLDCYSTVFSIKKFSYITVRPLITGMPSECHRL